ncbi:MAG TPA: hypothetical protein VF601_23060 [Beijerinckiaceae bacterium]|jgi:hypothetical protein
MGLVRDYWRHIHRLAFAEAADTLGLESRARIATGAIAVLVALGCLAFWGSADASRDELIARVAIGGVIVALFPFIYAWKLIQVPAKLDAETNPEGRSSSAVFEFGNIQNELAVRNPGEDLGGERQYYRLWCPIKFKQTVESVTIRVSVLRPLQPLDRHPPKIVWTVTEGKTYFQGDTENVVFACPARDRQHNGFYGDDMRRDMFYIGAQSKHLFEIDVLIGTSRATKRVYLESTPEEAYFAATRGFGQFGTRLFFLEEGADFFSSDWIKVSRDAVAGRIKLPLSDGSDRRGGFGFLGH